MEDNNFTTWQQLVKLSGGIEFNAAYLLSTDEPHETLPLLFGHSEHGNIL
jgi:hypothetical protein